MNKAEPGYSKRRLTGSHVTVIISVSLVLFLLGLLGLVIINAKSLSDYFRESLTFSIFLDDNTREADIRMLQKDLDAKHYVKSTAYISKDEAALKMKQELGEDFINFLGDNPLPPSIDVYLYAGYTSADSVAKIEKYVLGYSFVKEVLVPESLLILINENIRKISLFLLIISTFMFIIALTVINNTIRLAIYSRRFIIRTMQLVGATKSFVRKPFLVQSAVQGLIASLLAICLITALLYLVEKEFYMIFSLESPVMLFLLAGAIIITGVLISIAATFFSVSRYLNISEDKLYS
ncbi:MAG TPA: permease-like cell division protein FtsX [Bacteroidales bacterium]|nr:permease-like cell division protein FtsX [Bacteroidales bacterium]